MRMGSEKGSLEYWVAVVKPGRILYEMGRVPENIAKRAISIAASKMPIRTLRSKSRLTNDRAKHSRRYRESKPIIDGA
ncbi:hypothetical protein Ahy_B05g075867 [Arachis hypogaea]|uniref:Uncharacterized protein n=1 Tax=Arachis hypogaea TaxID=3818 RepID=A0A444Z2I2_ARAHY|nr:hypothetical protein Ahy_B05g075867 [Arachis hypogaea]